MLKDILDKLKRRKSEPVSEPQSRNGLTAETIESENVVVGTQIVNNYISASKTSLNPKQIETALRQYLGWLQRQYKNIPFFSYHAEDRRMKPIPIEAAYVQFFATIEDYGDVDSQEALKKQIANLGGKLALENILLLQEHTVLLAEAGMGKSIGLLRLAHWLAQGIEQNSSSIADRLRLARLLPLPVYVPLSLFAQHAKAYAGGAPVIRESLPAFIDRFVQDNSIGLPADFFSTLIAQDTPVVLLLDGLDEIVDEGWRMLVSGHIQSLSHSKANVRFVVTSRPSAYASHQRSRLGEGFVQLRLTDFATA